MILDFKQRLVDPSGYKPLKEHLDTLLLHRIAVGKSVAGIVDAFTGGLPAAAKVTGYKMPYHFVVDCEGQVTQTLSLAFQGPHAWKWNSRAIGICMIGDFRHESPTLAQWRAAATLCALLATPQKWQILGHDEAPGASDDPDKQCPGSRWPMDVFRAKVAEVLVTDGSINDFWRYVAC